MSGLLRNTIRITSNANSLTFSSIFKSQGISYACRHNLKPSFFNVFLSNQSILVRRAQLTPVRTIARWVAPSIKMLNSRKKRFAEKLPQVHKRSSFIDWNLNAEIYSFGQRLHEHFDLGLLTQAFTQRSYVVQEELRLDELGVDRSDLDMQDNMKLAEKGLEITTKYIEAYLRYHLPKYPDEGIFAIRNYLLSTEKLAYISSNLGTTEIILAAEYPPSDESKATTFLAIVGALEASLVDGNTARVHNFVRDFVCTHLNHVDINEIWKIEEPFEMLKRVCAERKILNIEARIIGEVGKGDILACCRIGIYDSDTKKMLGNGFGDTYDNGIETASIDALSRLFGSLNLKPFDFSIDSKQLFGLFGEKETKIRQIAK